ncbi:E3 ubiquitin- ligase DZIP3 [Paramuricea clavata]|uniref:E3 ubiquitin- ligase DZIP3 n=1 Tax=Paramuricea clavata TaxID=317549 RepID=A0A7D9EA58_PARCT|nr:E3 ubiquitin- ligase DZIP3 [Paramuricea clavata]
MTSILGSSDEKTNGFKLMRLIMDAGTEALRNAFRKIHPGNLQVVLSCTCSRLTTSCNKYILSKLRSHPKIINDDQWNKLYPPSSNPPNINDFDITLLSILLRNVCGLHPPCSGWDKMPNVLDHSVQADIVRIKLFRNGRFSHIPNTSVSTADFKAFLAEISSPLVRLGTDQKEIDRLENEMCGEDDILNKCLVRCNFQREVEFYCEKFTKGTREWVFEQFFTWFNDEKSGNRAFIISGLAGMGKSVIAAVICKRLAEHVCASHFFQYNNSHYNNPNILLQSLAWQLCQVVPPYKEALIQKLSGNLGQTLNNENIEGLFSILFKEPFSGISYSGERILIVLDAVDESEYYGRHELANLISNHLHKLPSYIRFLITTRPEKNLIDKFKQLNPLYIEGNDVRNLNDLKMVLQERCFQAGSVRSTNLIDSLAEKSDGLMLYAFLLSEIYNDKSSMFSIDSLPQGIEKHYEKYFRRLASELRLLEISEDKLFSLLSALAVAKEPFPEAFVKTLLGLEDSRMTMQKVRKAISSLLVINEDNTISFFHKSVRDWLVDNEHDYYVDVQDGHKCLFDECVIKLDELKQMDVRDAAMTNAAIRYSIKYWIPHMLNRPEDPSKLEHFVSNYAADLEVLFASVCVDVDLTLNNITILTNHEMCYHVSENTRATVSRLFSLIRRFGFLLRDYPHTFLQNVVNEGGEELSLKALSLLQTRYKDIIFLEFINKHMKNDPLQARCLLSGTISGIDISHNHDYVVCSYKEGGIELFSLTNGKSEWKIQDFKVELLSFPDNVDNLCMLQHCIVFHPRESLILPGRLYKALNMQGEFRSGPFQSTECCSKFSNCCFSSDNSQMVTHYGNNLTVWDILSGKKERHLPCKMLLSFSFTASGKFLGTVDIENVFKVYNVANDYNVYKSVTYSCQSPVEIVSCFEKNSWFCFFEDRISIVNHDFATVPPLQRDSLDPLDVVLPSNLCNSDELQCFLQHPEKSWFPKIKEILKDSFNWFWFTALRYILIGNNSVLIYSCSSNAMHVFSVEVLLDTEEQGTNMKGFFSNLSTNGDFVYFNNTRAQKFTIFNLDLNKEDPRACQYSSQLDIPVVRDGVILDGNNRTPELWNSDLTQRLASFDELAGTKQCLSVSDELIGCVNQSSITFFNVFTLKKESETIFNELVTLVHACSIEYYVLAQIDSSDVSLWKDGTRIDKWEDVFFKDTSLKSISFADFSPEGNRLAVFSEEINIIFIFDVASIKFLAQITIYGPSDDILRLKFFDNANLVCSSTNHTLYLINAERGEILTCVDLSDIPALIAVSRKRSIVFAALDRSVRFELIRVWLPR